MQPVLYIARNHYLDQFRNMVVTRISSKTQTKQEEVELLNPSIHQDEQKSLTLQYMIKS